MATLKARLKQQARGIGGGNTEDLRKQILKQRQQRLLLLRHASKCDNDVDCNWSCSKMKVLWRHIMECKELKCDTRHCVSSRHVLSHYSRCKNHTCPVCGPVRDAIRKRLSKRGFSQVRSDDDGHPDEQPVQKRAKLTTPSVMASAFEEGASHADQTLRLQVKLKLLTHSAYCEDSINCKEKRKCTKMKVFFLVSFTLIPLLTVLSRLS